MKRIILTFVSAILLLSSPLVGQELDNNEYKAQIGISGGGTYYIGEANNLLFNNLRPAYGGYARYLINQRFALRAEFLSTVVAGAGFSDNNVYVGDLCAEFNFFDLEKNPYKRFSKVFSPYIFTGISLFSNVYKGQQTPETGLPFGIGFKLKLGHRWNLDIKWSNRLLFADNLEGTTAPSIPDKYNNYNNLNGTNLLNNDLHSTLTIGIGYDIWKKQCNCMNTSYK